MIFLAGEVAAPASRRGSSKGKDADFGKAVTERELRTEVEKTKKFKPALAELILITTAEDDAVIQEKARLLEQEVRAAGREISIAIWGWGHLQREISRYPETLKAFHPDATPFSDQLVGGQTKILDGQAEIQKQLSQIVEMLRPAYEEGSLQLAKSAPATQIAADNEPVSNSLEKHLRDQIDTYRELSRNGRPKTAIELLTRLKDKVWDNASPRVRFRLLANIAARCISSPNSTWHKPGTKADWEMSAQTVRRKRS